MRLRELASDLVLGGQIVAMIDASLARALKADSTMPVSCRHTKWLTVNPVSYCGVVDTLGSRW
jgi:hypothetical protein